MVVQPPAAISTYFAVGVGAKTVQMQVAALPAEMEHGLMGRRDLAQDQGMIFLYARPQQLSFWMRDTPTPLDVGYFSHDGTLVEIYPMYAFDERTVSSRNRDLQYALEMNLGWYQANSIHPGDRLDMKALVAAIKARGFDPRKLGLADPGTASP